MFLESYEITALTISSKIPRRILERDPRIQPNDLSPLKFSNIYFRWQVTAEKKRNEKGQKKRRDGIESKCRGTETTCMEKMVRLFQS